MAIDTAEKRRAAGGTPFLPLGPGVTPMAAKILKWRIESAWGYPIIVGGPHCATESEVSTAGSRKGEVAQIVPAAQVKAATQVVGQGVCDG